MLNCRTECKSNEILTQLLTNCVKIHPVHYFLYRSTIFLSCVNIFHLLFSGGPQHTILDLRKVSQNQNLKSSIKVSISIAPFISFSSVLVSRVMRCVRWRWFVNFRYDNASIMGLNAVKISVWYGFDSRS